MVGSTERSTECSTPRFARRCLGAWRRRWLLLAGLSAACPAPALEAALRYPANEQWPDPQHDYVVELLRLTLRAAGSARGLEAVSLRLGQRRTLLAAAREQIDLDVMWSMTSRERETGPQAPVRIPIDRGLFGWRCLLVRAESLAAWAAVRDLAGLRERVALQGHDWPDTEILRTNGLQVVTGSVYDAMFRQLARGGVDYLPRSVLEVDAELQRFADLKLAVVPHLLLHYPTALYFFVDARRPELAELLRRGLEALVADGSMLALFERHHAQRLQAHRPEGRIVIELDNPLLPVATPLARRELWHWACDERAVERAYRRRR